MTVPESCALVLSRAQQPYNSPPFKHLASETRIAVSGRRPSLATSSRQELRHLTYRTCKDVVSEPCAHTGANDEQCVSYVRDLHKTPGLDVKADDLSLAMQGSLTRPDLKREMKYLEKLLYKNRNQHRESQHFRRLEEASPSWQAWACPQSPCYMHAHDHIHTFLSETQG